VSTTVIATSPLHMRVQAEHDAEQVVELPIANVTARRNHMRRCRMVGRGRPRQRNGFSLRIV